MPTKTSVDPSRESTCDEPQHQLRELMLSGNSITNCARGGSGVCTDFRPMMIPAAATNTRAAALNNALFLEFRRSG
jgi:hypothetical protein